VKHHKKTSVASLYFITTSIRTSIRSENHTKHFTFSEEIARFLIHLSKLTTNYQATDIKLKKKCL